MNNKIHVKMVGLKPDNLTKLFQSFFTDEFNPTNRLDFQNLDLVLDLNVGEKPPEGLIKVICGLPDCIEELYYHPLDETEQKPKETILHELEMKIGETESVSVDDKQTEEPDTSMQENPEPNKDDTGKSESPNSDENVEQETDLGEMAEQSSTTENEKSGKRRRRKKTESKEGLLPLSAVDELLEKSGDRKDFVNRFSEMLKVPSKRVEQFEVLFDATSDEDTSWKVIYDRIQAKGFKFSISDQQIYSRLIANVFEDKILKVLQYANAKSAEKSSGPEVEEDKPEQGTNDVAAPVSTSNESDFDSDDYGGEEPDESELYSSPDEATGDEEKEKDIISASMIFSNLSNLSSLPEVSKAKVRDLELRILNIDKELPIKKRIENVLKMMLDNPEYNESRIQELTDYFAEIFSKREISFELEQTVDSSFKVKMKIRKAISVFCKQYYNTDTTEVESFLENLRFALLTDDEREEFV